MAAGFRPAAEAVFWPDGVTSRPVWDELLGGREGRNEGSGILPLFHLSGKGDLCRDPEDSWGRGETGAVTRISKLCPHLSLQALYQPLGIERLRCEALLPCHRGEVSGVEAAEGGERLLGPFGRGAPPLPLQHLAAQDPELGLRSVAAAGPEAADERRTQEQEGLYSLSRFGHGLKRPGFCSFSWNNKANKRVIVLI